MEVTFNNTAPGKQPTDRGTGQPANLASATITMDATPASRMSQGSKTGHNKSASAGSKANTTQNKR